MQLWLLDSTRLSIMSEREMEWSHWWLKEGEPLPGLLLSISRQATSLVLVVIYLHPPSSLFSLYWQCDWFLNVDYETTLTEVIFSPLLEERVTIAFNISIIDDTAVEPTEQFEVFLNASQEAVLTEREANSARVNIIDDDSKLCMWESIVNNWE